MAKELAPLKHPELRAAFKKDLAAAWHQARSLHPKEVPYAFVVYGLEGTPHFYPHVLTEEGLGKSAQRYIDNGTFAEMTKAKRELRYSIEDSPHASDLEEMFPTVDVLVALYEEDWEETPGYQLLAKAAMEAFEELDEEGVFGQGRARERVLLMIMTPESEKNWDLPSVKRLNSPAAFKRYKNETIEKDPELLRSANVLTLSVDARTLYFGGDRMTDFKRERYVKEFVACDLDGTKVQRRWTYPFPFGGLAEIADAALAPDGTVVALRTKFQGISKCTTFVLRFGSENNTVLQQAELIGEPMSLAISTDGSHVIVVMKNRTVYCFDAQLRLKKTEKYEQSIRSLHFLKSGDALVVTDSGLLRLDNQFQLKPTSYDKPVADISVDAAEKLMAMSQTFSWKEHRISREPFGFEIVKLPGLRSVLSVKIPRFQLLKATLSSDGRFVAFCAHEAKDSGKKFLVIYDVGSVREVARRECDWIKDMQFLPDNRTVVFTLSGWMHHEPISFWQIP